MSWSIATTPGLERIERGQRGSWKPKQSEECEMTANIITDELNNYSILWPIFEGIQNGHFWFSSLVCCRSLRQKAHLGVIIGRRDRYRLGSCLPDSHRTNKGSTSAAKSIGG